MKVLEILELFLSEDPNSWWFDFEVWDGNELDRGWNTPWFSLCENFHLYKKILEFWLFFLYLDTGRLVGELEMNICSSLTRARVKIN